MQFPAGCGVHPLIEAQAERTPDAVAVIYGEERLTYRELNARANQLAHHLLSLGARPELPAALCMQRSPGLIVALLGLLKAGCANLPLDPDFPRERLAFMLGDSRPAFLLTDPELAGQLPATGIHALIVPVEPVQCAEPLTNPPNRLLPHNLAYLMYTSGSAGRPKGVMHSQAALHSYLRQMQSRYPLSPDDRVLFKTSISFGISLWEMLWPLTVGAAVVVAGADDHLAPDKLVQLIAAHSVSVVHFVPSLLGAFLDAPGLAQCASLRHVLSGGETLPPALAQRLLARLPGVALHNHFGATECANYACIWDCAPGDTRTIVPLGFPAPPAQALLLDQAMQPVESGEIFLGGEAVARGYLGRPDLTAERFVPNPLAQQPGERLYRTGDLARRLPGGALSGLGRSDDQVKLNGVRVEPGEVEAALRRHSAVRDCAVVAIKHGDADVRLSAFVVPGADQAGAAPLRAYLQTQLAAYQIPARFYFRSALPLTPSGKLDRRALRLAAGGAPSAAASGAPPRTPLEALLADIWREVLHVERFGIDESFWELGGDSLAAAAVLARITRQLGVALPAGALNDAPSVASLALAITDLQAHMLEPANFAALLQQVERLPESEAQRLASVNGSSTP